MFTIHEDEEFNMAARVSRLLYTMTYMRFTLAVLDTRSATNPCSPEIANHCYLCIPKYTDLGPDDYF